MSTESLKLACSTQFSRRHLQISLVYATKSNANTRAYSTTAQLPTEIEKPAPSSNRAPSGATPDASESEKALAAIETFANTGDNSYKMFDELLGKVVQSKYLSPAALIIILEKLRHLNFMPQHEHYLRLEHLTQLAISDASPTVCLLLLQAFHS